jgi:hypothetical protein
LTAVRFRQVELHPSVQAPFLGENRFELERDFRADFEAARANSWPDRCPNMVRPRAELERHCLDRSPGNFQRGSPPSCVDCPTRARFRVDQQHRQTIRRPNANQYVWVF